MKWISLPSFGPVSWTITKTENNNDNKDSNKPHMTDLKTLTINADFKKRNILIILYNSLQLYTDIL